MRRGSRRAFGRSRKCKSPLDENPDLCTLLDRHICTIRNLSAHNRAFHFGHHDAYVNETIAGIWKNPRCFHCDRCFLIDRLICSRVEKKMHITFSGLCASKLSFPVSSGISCFIKLSLVPFLRECKFAPTRHYVTSSI